MTKILVGSPYLETRYPMPCFNEEATLAYSLDQIPKTFHGIDEIEFLIINDGSTDKTVEVAKDWGVHKVVGFSKNKGLAKAFMLGIENAIAMGADIIVNTDADNQYEAQDIQKLIDPILQKKADIVVGERPIGDIEHFSPIKKVLQKLGSWVVRRVSNTQVQDAPSGFRALSRDAALSINVFSSYTYTLETIIEAGQKNMSVVSVPIRVNQDLRPSKLVKSIPDYIKKQLVTIVRIFVLYKPFRFFMTIGVFLMIPGLFLGFRFVYFALTGDGKGHVQSLILAAVLVLASYQTMMLAFVADLLSVNRRLIEKLNALIKSSSS
ncbi:MAG: glycosyltransferase family 2 protein [Bdellovibrionales bacterium]|nr:glycosyltransferase family 2 protein [Bdellovibrionales bacterium]